MINYMHQLGQHYCGTTSWDLFYRQLMFIIKYATKHSQSIMAGCTNYSYQYQAASAENNVNRVIIAKTNAANLIVGSYVSIGNIGTASKDRYYATVHDLAYSVQITKIEDSGDSNSAVYVDSSPFNTTTDTYISTMPWHSGSTDAVLGSDGSLGSNTWTLLPEIQAHTCETYMYVTMQANCLQPLQQYDPLIKRQKPKWHTRQQAGNT